MRKIAMCNFHVPLSEELYNRLRSEASRIKQPATVLAREAIENWIKQKEREVLHQQIAAYATACAGTEADLDKNLEAAAVEFLLEQGESS